ncbi:MAG: DUF3179 domain-containing protein [Chitinophagaceae bacterium]|nr:DUF3179 domain-containing protein [Chitinophagaceae bacterium]
MSYNQGCGIVLLLMNRFLLFVCLLILIFAEIFRVYLVMPYPGSQVKNTILFAHWLNVNITWIRILSGAVLLGIIFSLFAKGQAWEKLILSVTVISYGAVFYLFNYKLAADKIFYQPNINVNSYANDSLDRSKLVIGVTIQGEAKAYPIQLIGYHHQVRDTVGNTEVMITYCTVCRTGRVFSPLVKGKSESFRLVGMDHFNALFEDRSTKSWWQQATGRAIAGPLKGTVLKEFPSNQLTLDAWLRKHPDSKIMRPDMTFMDNYFRLEDYDKGRMRSDLVRRDFVSWNPKAWVIGVKNGNVSKAYDWNQLVAKRIIEDSIANMPVLLTIESDTTSFHAYDRRVKGVVLNFIKNSENDLLTDQNTKSTWNVDGLCIDGPLKDQRLTPVQAYNEFWHSWQTFQANTERYITN